MKHLLTYLFFGALLVSLGSCSKKGNPTLEEDHPLIGTWEAVRAVEREYIGGELSYEIDTENPDDGFTFDMDIQFIDESRVRVSGDDIDGTIETTYSLSNDGKTLSVNDVDGAFAVIQIKKLTATDMEWFIEGDANGEEDDAAPQTERYEAEIYLKKAN